MKFEKCLDVNGTSFCFNLIKDYATMVELFGEPHWQGDGDKVRVEWCFRFEDGIVFTIYDWKEECPIEQVTDWHFGGLYKNNYEIARRINSYVDSQSDKVASCNNCGGCNCGGSGAVQSSDERHANNNSLKEPPTDSIMIASKGDNMITNQRLARLDQIAKSLDREDLALLLLMYYYRLGQETMVGMYADMPEEATSSVESVSCDLVFDLIADMDHTDEQFLKNLNSKYKLQDKYRFYTGMPVKPCIIEPSFEG